jgi:radical SAM superfamily enzyme YgiQ (UPF0313 family)
MTIVLCAINSRFSHTSPAIRSLALHAEACLSGRPEQALVTDIHEYTTAQPVDAIARDLFGLQGEVYGFTCSIWNRRPVLDVAAQLREMRPEALIVVGGPEVTPDAAGLLQSQPAIDMVVRGEGEAAFAKLLEGLLDAHRPSTDSTAETCADSPFEKIASPTADVLSRIPGLTWRNGGLIVNNPVSARPLDLSFLPFPYEKDLHELKDRMLYYESSRGCPFQCAYCLSATDRQMRFRPIGQTLAHLDRFIDAGARLVKLVDRTFNCDPERARSIWSHLITRHRRKPFTTCFHFEIAADLLTEADIALLSEAPKGLFQLEIGVQSTDPGTLRRINRHCDLPRLFERVRQLRQADRQHLHLDLIAGLPGERLDQVIASFNTLYCLQADQLQLGFLKLLPGTPILEEIEPCQYRYQPFPPYEVLSTADLPADALCRLHEVESALELFANSGLFRRTLPHLVEHFDSPYAFFSTLSDRLVLSGERGRGVSVDERAGILARLARSDLPEKEADRIVGLLRLDHYEHGRKDAPAHLGALETTAEPDRMARITDLRRAVLPGRRIRIEAFPFDARVLLENGRLTDGADWILYDLSGQTPEIVSILPEPPASADAVAKWLSSAVSASR